MVGTSGRAARADTATPNVVDNRSPNVVDNWCCKNVLEKRKRAMSAITCWGLSAKEGAGTEKGVFEGVMQIWSWKACNVKNMQDMGLGLEVRKETPVYRGAFEK